MPGATFTHESRREQRLDERPGRASSRRPGRCARRRCVGPGRRTRRRTVRCRRRRVGDADRAAETEARRGWPRRPRPGRGSRSTPTQVMPASAMAIRSPPMPQPRSTRVVVPNAVSRPARCRATGSRVACSRPSGVKYIRAALGPSLASARRRSSTWVSAAATCSAVAVRRSAVCTANAVTVVAASPAVADVARSSSCWPSSVSSHRKASRSTPLILTAAGRPLAGTRRRGSASFGIGTLHPRVPALVTRCDPRDGVPHELAPP